MKKLSKLAIAIFLSTILIFSTVSLSFAGDDGDPDGGHKSISNPIIGIVR